MGSDKALLKRDGRTQLARAVELLEPRVARVFVSTREDQSEETERSRYAQIMDRYSGLGPVAGILSAMDTNPEVNWLIVACDLPNLDAVTVDKLLAQHRDDEPFTAYRSSHDGLPEPLCAIYSPQSRELIRRFVDEGLHCPRKMLIRSDARLLEQPNPGALDNINTPEDLAALETGAAM